MSQSVPSALGPQPKCRLGTRAQGYTTQGYKRTPHKSTGLQGYTTQGYTTQGTKAYFIANYWLWVRHSITPLQLFIISCTLVRQNTIVLHCIFKTAYWCSKCILLDTNYCTLYIGTADVHNTMCWKSIQQCSWPTVLSQ